MKKFKFLAGLCLAATGVFALASCTDGMTTNVKKAENYTPEVIDKYVESYEATHTNSTINLIQNEGDSTISNYNGWVYYKASLVEGSYVYEYFSAYNNYVISVDESDSIKYTNGFFLTYTMLESGEYAVDIYTMEGFLTTINTLSITIYTDKTFYYEDNSINYKCNVYTIEGLGQDEYIYEILNLETKEITYKFNEDPRIALQDLEPGYSELGNYYIKSEQLSDGVKISLQKRIDNITTQTYNPFFLPNNLSAFFIFNDLIVYQTKDILPEDAKEYTYYEFDNGGGLSSSINKFKVETYTYDLVTNKEKQINCDYVIADAPIISYIENSENDLYTIEIYKIQDGLLDENTTLFALINEDLDIEYVSNQFDLESLMKLPGGAYFNSSNQYLYNANLEFVAQVDEVISTNSTCFFVCGDYLFDDKACNIMHLPSIENKFDNVYQIGDIFYEFVDNECISIGQEIIYDDYFIYEVVSEMVDENVVYRITARLIGTNVSTTFYSQAKSRLTLQYINYNTSFMTFNSTYNIYTDIEMTNKISNIFIK